MEMTAVTPAARAAYERSLLARHTLSELESALDPEKFVRIHRTTIVNADRVRAIEALPQGDFSVMLTTGARAVSSVIASLQPHDRAALVQ